MLGDGQLIGTIPIKGGGLPVEFSFDITGVKLLNIIADGKKDRDKAVGFANVVVK